MANINVSALGQALDTTWGRSSTPKTASYSVKFKLQGDRLVASYTAVVNFGTEQQMIDMKRRYSDESVNVIEQVMKSVKDAYKEISGTALKVKEASTRDDIEIIGLGVYNPKRTAYYRRNTVFDLA